MACICCGREGVPTFRIPSHIGTLRACATCQDKIGAVELGLEADRLLTDWYMSQRPKPECQVCHGPVILYSDGSVPVWCAACEAKRQALVRRYAG
jgi:hypothetical protein